MTGAASLVRQSGYSVVGASIQQTVGVAAALIADASGASAKFRGYLIRNVSISGQIIAIGDNAVVASTGLPLYPGDSAVFEMLANAQFLYGISSAAGGLLSFVNLYSNI